MLGFNSPNPESGMEPSVWPSILSAHRSPGVPRGGTGKIYTAKSKKNIKAQNILTFPTEYTPQAYLNHFI
jgi:hypothetical protein